MMQNPGARVLVCQTHIKSRGPGVSIWLYTPTQAEGRGSGSSVASSVAYNWAKNHSVGSFMEYRRIRLPGVDVFDEIGEFWWPTDSSLISTHEV